MISIIVAVDENNAIGKDNKLLWHLPADLKRFKSITMGHVVVMGRKTFESIGKPLPGRINVIVSRRNDFKPEGALVYKNLDEALKAFSDRELFIIGGADVYAQSIGLADRIYLTRVYGTFDADSFFPAINHSEWRIVKTEQHEPDGKNKFRYAFIDYERRRN